MALVQTSSELIVGAGVNTGNVTFASNTTAGNLVVLKCFNLGGASVAFSSSGFGVDKTSNVQGIGVAILSQPNVAGGVNSYTVNLTSANSWNVIAEEWSGVVTTASPGHIEASASNNDDTTTAPTAAPAGQIDTTLGGPIVAAYSIDRTLATITPPSGFAGARTTAHPSLLSQGYSISKNASGASTDERGAITTSAGSHYDAVIVAYKSSAPTAPVLSSPTTVSTGNTIATVRVTTDTAPTGSSILAVQVLPAGDATPTAAAILATPTQTITSGASGARDFNLTGLTNGTAYKAHFAQTGPSNVVSTASFTPSTVPGAPTIGTAVAGNAQATVNGTAPGSDGGSAITGYRSTATPGGSTVTGASLPITHTGLTNGTAYTFTLAAQNANGYGAESAASNSVTPSSGADVTPPTLGGSITIGTVTSSSIQASWSAGADNVAVTGYEVSSNGGSTWTDVGNVLTYTFTGLTPSTSYALRVRAKDAAGNVSSPLSATQSTSAASLTTYSATTDIIARNGIALASTAIFWTWLPAGRPGQITAAINGSGITDSAGRYTVTHTVAGNGLFMAGLALGAWDENAPGFAQYLTLA